MNITTQQLLDIKCVLAKINKKQVANDLRVNSVDLSRPITNENLITKLNDYFDSIDPEINLICNKFQEKNLWKVEEEGPKYRKSGSSDGFSDPKYLKKLIDIQEKHIKHLEDDVWTLKVDIQKISRKYPDILKTDFGLSGLSQTGS